MSGSMAASACRRAESSLMAEADLGTLPGARAQLQDERRRRLRQQPGDGPGQSKDRDGQSARNPTAAVHH